MTRFSITMDEALNFILKATELGKGSEIFIPKLKSYGIKDVKDALTELIGDYGNNVVGIRPGEKLHETLINKEEMRYAWEFQDLFMLTSPLYPMFNANVINQTYDGVKEIVNMESYSSDNVEKISKVELKNIFQKLNLI